MTTVLIPVDGSEYSLRGVSLVISRRSRYANPEDVQIHLVNVQAPFPHFASSFASREQVAGFHEEESREQLREACRLLDSAGVRYTCHYKVGDAAEVITALADKLTCDEIVMGAHGRSAVADAIVGSVSRKVVHLSKIPVLLIK